VKPSKEPKTNWEKKIFGTPRGGAVRESQRIGVGPGPGLIGIGLLQKSYSGGRCEPYVDTRQYKRRMYKDREADLTS